MKNFGYGREEKLKKKSEIEHLFKNGKWQSSGSVRIIFVNGDAAAPATHGKIGVSVSKKFFKKAVHRNRIKRLLRESYRLHKPVFYERFGTGCRAMLFWTSTEMPENLKTVEADFLRLCAPKL